MKEILEHNALFRSDMSDEELLHWIDTHLTIMNKYNQFTGERR